MELATKISVYNLKWIMRVSLFYMYLGVLTGYPLQSFFAIYGSKKRIFTSIPNAKKILNYYFNFLNYTYKVL